jgi:hypothetical protein
MTTIWKFQLRVWSIWRSDCRQFEQEIAVPTAARFLSAQIQGDQLCLWALVNPKAPLQLKRIVILGTGHPVPTEQMRFIDTVQMENGALIWHIFECL